VNPILKHLKNLFAAKRILEDDVTLQGIAKADALLTNLVNQNRVPGLAITVLKAGEVVLQKGYGYADLENKIPVDPINTIFRVASVSKPIAATALAQMVAEGYIALDASFYDYVPYYPKKKYDFTLRQLAGHTAGIRGYKGKEYALNKPYSIKEGIEIFKNDDLLFEPGTNYLYNSYDWVLVSLAMQEVCKMPFEDYVGQKVMQPLGLKNTFVEEQGKPYKRAATFYTKNRLGFRKSVPVNNGYKMAGGGYQSTSREIAQLGQAYLERKITGKAILAQFLTSQTIKGVPTYYGLGWEVSGDKSGRPYYGHVGNGVGGYANFFVYPKQHMVFSMLINCTNPQVQEVLDAVVDALFTLEKIDLPG